MPVDEPAEFQEIVNAEGRPARGNLPERILRRQIRQVGQKGLEGTDLVVIENPVFTPSELSLHQFVLGAPKGMKRMGNAEPALGRPHTARI